MIDPNYEHNTTCLQLDAAEAELIILALESCCFSPHLAPISGGIIEGLTEFFTTDNRPVNRKLDLDKYSVSIQEGCEPAIESDYEEEDDEDY